MHPDDVLAVELFLQGERFGWDLVTSLRPLRLTRWRADMLMLRLEWLDRYQKNLRKAQQPSGAADEYG